MVVISVSVFSEIQHYLTVTCTPFFRTRIKKKKNDTIDLFIEFSRFVKKSLIETVCVKFLVGESKVLIYRFQFGGWNLLNFIMSCTYLKRTHSLRKLY